jgi:hypothetical protein
MFHANTPIFFLPVCFAKFEAKRFERHELCEETYKFTLLDLI